MGLCLALAAGVVSAVQSAPSLTQAAIVATVCLMVTMWGRQLRLIGVDYVRAGAIAERLLSEIVAANPFPVRGTRLEVFGVPKYEGPATLFLTYFDHALRQRYRRDDLEVIAHYVPEQEASPLIEPSGRCNRSCVQLTWTITGLHAGPAVATEPTFPQSTP